MDYVINNLLPSHEALQELYLSVGWHIYVARNKNMQLLLKNAYTYVTAWHDEQLIGLCRVISDGLTIAYIQDILIRPEFQNKGLGSHLIKDISQQLEGIRQIVLITDATSKTIAFYEANQLKVLDKYGCVGFMKLNDNL
ncbi:GNAT family N-acetyltransferase [Streptococcus pseudoporcinus]|uniref:GNAT family N-acetyltransferase n=1 Tax=Streptococcus pseudoporcinus TaxID=361101 RepID=UPI0001EB356E|nr:GNAT family N-acetyltransferase [Streptococcus pseudoporcinus]EFR45122.1 acetyltransferase, GNAT family [Streptococcus pseudoporcinus SPIN 20026]